GVRGGAGAGMIVGLHHVQLAVPAGSEPALREFYGGVLGMTEVTKPAALAGRGGAWFRSGSVELHLGVDPEFRPARKAHPALLVDDLGAVAAQLDVRWDDLLPGYRRCYVEDPCGNRLELLAPS
ncbi:MAG TPA: glyoxalase, partial [Mycobacteriales bacterium]|nr:glyoxalase [Mycobacteriales bacterium]